MSVEVLFSICNMVAILGWLLLIFLPRWRYSAGLITSVLIPTLLAIVYALLVLPRMGELWASYGSLSAVMRILQEPGIFVAAWIHYLAFDLFIGAWEVRDAQRLGISHLAVIPSLLLTFGFGPIGLLVYFQLRWFWGKSVVIGERARDASVSS
jgi:hypothetical protein